MKITFLALSLIILSNIVIAQITAIPDANFEQALIDLGYDDVIDGQVLTANINTITVLNISDKNISNLTGIENFTLLNTLYCSWNNLDSLDFAQNINLTTLDFSKNDISYLFIDNNINITSLECISSSLDSLNISNLTNLSLLNCEANSLSKLDISNNPKLETLYCSANNLTKLDLSSNINLDYIMCEHNKIDSLDFSHNSNINSIECGDNLLSMLNVKNKQNLETLDCGNNLLTSLDLSTNTNLSSLNCRNNTLDQINLKNGNNVNMTDLQTFDNPNLKCISVDDSTYVLSNWTLPYFKLDEWTNYYNTPCADIILKVKNTELIDVSIFPNPTNDYIIIEKSNEEFYNVKICNIKGSILINETISEKEHRINMKSLSQGAYFIHLENYKGEIYSFKMMKK